MEAERLALPPRVRRKTQGARPLCKSTSSITPLITAVPWLVAPALLAPPRARPLSARPHSSTRTRRGTYWWTHKVTALRRCLGGASLGELYPVGGRKSGGGGGARAARGGGGGRWSDWSGWSLQKAREGHTAGEYVQPAERQPLDDCALLARARAHPTGRLLLGQVGAVSAGVCARAVASPAQGLSRPPRGQCGQGGRGGRSGPRCLQ